MPQDYLPIFCQIIFAVLFALIVLGLSFLCGRKGGRNKAKDSAYECGVVSEGGIPKFSIKFYVIAMLFVIFDVEVVFLYAWAVEFRELITSGAAVLFGAAAFVGILAAAYIYATAKGALKWQ